jgi:glycine/D-amino acid oxidase-like deaminating enzyme
MFFNREGKAMRAAIIGAGVLGASTALHPALTGAEVVVADRAHAGQATAAGADIVSPWSSGRIDFPNRGSGAKPIARPRQAGIQLPWKPCGTRRGITISATGARSTSRASRMAQTEPSVAWSYT